MSKPLLPSSSEEFLLKSVKSVASC